MMSWKCSLSPVDVLKKCTGDDEIIFERKGMDANRSFRSYGEPMYNLGKMRFTIRAKNSFLIRMVVKNGQLRPMRIMSECLSVKRSQMQD